MYDPFGNELKTNKSTMKQIVDHQKKTYYYSEQSPTVITQTMTISKQGYYTSESDLKARGYTNLGKSLELLRQMGKLKEPN